ncbi:TolC family protein [candidate division KSB1 bacterium]|nr:TolC family protein [candidate division KSB1 bacterium]MBL7094421.1 TolC family protein [candidate division KSB1 bacterium]
MKIINRISVLVLILNIQFVFAQEKLTLEDAIGIALKNNHQINIARNNAEIDNNNVNIGNTNLLPRIDASTSANYQDSSTPSGSEMTSAASTLNTAQLQVSYTLFDGFNNILQFNRLKISGKIGDLEARNAIEKTLFQVSNGYYNSALAWENLTIAKELLTISKERVERAKKRSTYGQANTIEVLSAQVDLNSDSVVVVNAKLFWQQSRRDLILLLNIEQNREFEVDTEVTFTNNMKLSELNNFALKNNASYLSAINRYKQSKIDLKIARASYSPQLSVQTSYGYSQSNPDFDLNLNDPTKTFRAGATLSLNLFNGFKNNIQRQNAQIGVNSQKLASEEARLELVNIVTNSYEAYQNSLIVLKLEQKNLEVAELNFKRTQELFNLGQVTTTQFREAQLNLIRAKNSISTAKFEAKLYEIDLLRLSGRLVKESE